MSDCVQCERLRKETALAFAEYTALKDELAMTRKTDNSFVAKRKAYKRAQGRFREYQKRELQHHADAHRRSS